MVLLGMLFLLNGLLGHPFRFSRVRRTSVGGSFHQQDPCIRHSLKSSIHFNVPLCDRPRTPLPMITTNLTAAHDPSMPTLSPQQPAPNQNSNLSSNTLNELNNDFVCDQNTSQTTPSSTHLSTAPQPPSLLPKPESNSALSSVLKVICAQISFNSNFYISNYSILTLFQVPSFFIFLTFTTLV